MVGFLLDDTCKTLDAVELLALLSELPSLLELALLSQLALALWALLLLGLVAPLSC